MYIVEFTRSSAKELKAIDSKASAKIIKKIKVLAGFTANKALDIKKLKGLSNAYRLRIGSYRVIYEIKNTTLIITIVKIGSRGDIYG